jgi:RNA polymerase sigma-70 factor (ECF subfamily)
MTAEAVLEQDSHLMLQVRAGNAESFELLLTRHRASVIRFLYRMVHNQAIAEELAQEAFLRVYRSRDSYEPTAKFRTWLFRIATNLALNWLRTGRTEQANESLEDDTRRDANHHLADRAPTAEAGLVEEVTTSEIRKAIDGLPEKQKAAVLMHKYEDMGYSQIAGVLECSESAVKSLVFRAYQTLRVRLAHLA